MKGDWKLREKEYEETEELWHMKIKYLKDNPPHVARIKRGLLHLFYLFCLLLAPPLFLEKAAGNAPKIAFSVENSIFLTDLQGAAPQKIAQGYDPEISPRGDMVAFTFYTQKGDRMIAVIPLSEGKEPGKMHLFSSIPGKNSYGPRWSPDGSALLFNHWVEEQGDWVLGLLTLQDEAFRILAPEQGGLYSPFWSARGTSVFAQDLDSIYQIDVERGVVMGKMPLFSVLGETMASSAVHFAISPDGSKWLFDAEIEGTPEWQKLDIPLLSAIFLYTPEDGKTRRITNNSICALHPAWLPGGEEFIFSGYTPEDAVAETFPFRIFRQSLQSSSPELLLSRGDSPSSAR